MAINKRGFLTGVFKVTAQRNDLKVPAPPVRCGQPHIDGSTFVRFVSRVSV